MIPSPFHSARGSKPVRLIIVHTAEGSTTVESLGRWFQNVKAQASSHAGIDDHRTETFVPYDRTAWTTRSANPISDSVELCGFAKWTRDEWMQHGRMLELCAQWIRDRCTARGIPIRKLSPADVAAGKAGVCGHVDWTVGMHDGTHTDPGPAFPWDHVIALASGGADQEDDMPNAQDIAAAVVAQTITNFNGDKVSLAQVINGIEKREADLQATVAKLAADLAAVKAKLAAP